MNYKPSDYFINDYGSPDGDQFYVSFKGSVSYKMKENMEKGCTPRSPHSIYFM